MLLEYLRICKYLRHNTDEHNRSFSMEIVTHNEAMAAVNGTRVRECLFEQQVCSFERTIGTKYMKIAAIEGEAAFSV